MANFKVYWSKSYTATGTVEIEAVDEAGAYRQVDDMIGDFDGSMQYHPDDNTIEVFKR